MSDRGVFDSALITLLSPLSYQGTWNANTNTPTLASGVGTKGYVYVVSVAGNTNLDGITDWEVSDWAVFNGTAWQKVDNSEKNLGAIEVLIDGNSFPITTGLKGYREVPFNCSIVGVRLLADQSTTTVVDIWKDTYANYPPTDADTITGGNEPTITAAIKMEDTTLTSWTTALTKGDILGFNIDSNNNAQKLNVILDVVKT